MKKIFSISFAFLILLAGTNFSIATHICGGKVAAVKWSFSGEKATCGMENSKSDCSDHNTIASNCCHNEVTVYSVDNNYNPSSFQLKEIKKKVLQVFSVPVSFSFNAITTNFLRTDTSPPGNLLTNAVNLADICVFRI
jgi:hypothetical protein